MSKNAAVAPIIISLNVKFSLRKDKDVIKMLALPKYIFSLFECVKSCSEAGKQGSDIILAYTGITGSSVVNTTEMFDLLYYNQGIESRESKEEPANDTEDHKDR